MPTKQESESLRKKPLSDNAVELLVKMQDESLLMLTSATVSIHTTNLELYSYRDLESIKDSEIPFKLTHKLMDSLYNRAYINQLNKKLLHEKMTARGLEIGKKPNYSLDGGTYLIWSAMPYGLTALGREAVNELRPRYNDILRAREAQEEEPRFVVAASLERTGLFGGFKRTPGVGNAYRIVRETPGRIYISGTKTEDNIPVQDGWDYAVKGTGKNKWIEKEDVVQTDVSPEQYRSMYKATKEFNVSLSGATKNMEDEITPIKRRFEQRKDQLTAQLEDEMRDALGANGTAFKR